MLTVGRLRRKESFSIVSCTRHLIVNDISEGIAHCRLVCESVCEGCLSIMELMGTGGLAFLELILGVVYMYHACVRGNKKRSSDLIRHPLQASDLTSADPEGETGGPDPPGKSQVIWVSIGNKQLDPPPWKKLPPPPPPGKC